MIVHTSVDVSLSDIARSAASEPYDFAELVAELAREYADADESSQEEMRWQLTRAAGEVGSGVYEGLRLMSEHLRPATKAA